MYPTNTTYKQYTMVNNVCNIKGLPYACIYTILSNIVV